MLVDTTSTGASIELVSTETETGTLRLKKPEKFGIIEGAETTRVVASVLVEAGPGKEVIAALPNLDSVAMDLLEGLTILEGRSELELITSLSTVLLNKNAAVVDDALTEARAEVLMLLRHSETFEDIRSVPGALDLSISVLNVAVILVSMPEEVKAFD